MKLRTSVTGIQNFILIIITIVLFGCGSPQQNGLTLQDVPVYPNATEGETMQANMLGMMGAGLAQYSTTDAYDEVMAFYSKALEKHKPDVMNHSSELGRQSAYSIKKDNGLVTVSVQEFREENSVSITFMEVSN